MFFKVCTIPLNVLVKPAHPTLCAFSLRCQNRFIWSPCCLYIFFKFLTFVSFFLFLFIFRRSCYFSGDHSCVKSNFPFRKSNSNLFFSKWKKTTILRMYLKVLDFFICFFYCLYKNGFGKSCYHH
jgi:hypothetical protein